LSGAAEPSAPELSDAARARLAPIVELLAGDPAAPSSVRQPEDAWRVHVADSLSGLVVPELAAAGRIADVGAGAGFPGLVLAAALPGADVDLIESTGRKCEFMRRALGASGIPNARVVCERAETWAEAPEPDGARGAYDVVTARAVGRLATLAELASPLLRPDGVLVAWKGRRDADEEAELARAAERLGMAPEQILEVGPFAGSRHRHLHTMRKTSDTPAELPRRPGMAKKRPLGSREGR
jgi:16S rRNA (guanine527-N7)-methyltransferase